MSLVLDDLPRDPDQLLRHLQQMAEVIARQNAALSSLQTERDAVLAERDAARTECDAVQAVGSIAKCESPTFAGTCPSETPLARTYRHLDLDQRRTLFRLVEARPPVGEIARRLGRHPSTVYRELGRNRFRDGDRGFCGYFPLNARDLARRRRQRRRKPGPPHGVRADPHPRPHSPPAAPP